MDLNDDTKDGTYLTKEEHEQLVKDNPDLVKRSEFYAKKRADRRKWMEEHGDVSDPDWW